MHSFNTIATHVDPHGSSSLQPMYGMGMSMKQGRQVTELEVEAVVAVAVVVALNEVRVVVSLAVQYPQVKSQAPANWQVGQKMRLQMSLGQSSAPHVRLQNSSPMVLFGAQAVSVPVCVEIDVVLADVVVVVSVAGVVVILLALLVVMETVAVVLEVPVEDIVVVEFSWQYPQVVSHMRAAEQVGQKVTSHSDAMKVHTLSSRQSSSFGHVVAVDVRVTEPV
jgi:hypothetical protein